MNTETKVRPRPIPETRDDYPNVVCQTDDWRIIECPLGIQWILQFPAGFKGCHRRWKNRCYCRSKKALIQFSHTYTGGISPKELAILDALPDWIEQGGARP